MIRLLALVQKRPGLSPGQRFRLEQWAPRLEADHGIKLEFLPFESPSLTEIIYRPGLHAKKGALVLRDAARRGRALLGAHRYDGVIVYREASLLGPAIYERLLAASGLPVFVDFDDAIWIQSKRGPNGLFSLLRFAGKTATICKLSRSVIVGNEYLASYARRFSSSVFIVPTTIELREYPLQPLLEDEPFTIVWSGSLSTLICLEHARDAIEAFGKKRRVVLRVIGNKAPEQPYANVENVFVPWRGDEEARAIGQAHAGIMPIPDTAYTRGKCALKALQYMAAGVPVVVSPVGVNADVVKHGENGLHASTTAEWVDAFERLATSSELRRTLRAAGRRTIEESYSSDVGAALFARAITAGLARERQGSGRAEAGSLTSGQAY